MEKFSSSIRELGEDWGCYNSHNCMKALCDICKREYEADDDLSDDRNFNIERLCPDCEYDIAESEIIKEDICD